MQLTRVWSSVSRQVVYAHVRDSLQTQMYLEVDEFGIRINYWTESDRDYRNHVYRISFRNRGQRRAERTSDSALDL